MSKVFLGDPFEITPVNVYDKFTKQIVFTGSQIDAALFIGTSKENVNYSVRRKSCIKKKFVVRFAKNV